MKFHFQIWSASGAKQWKSQKDIHLSIHAIQLFSSVTNVKVSLSY